MSPMCTSRTTSSSVVFLPVFLLKRIAVALCCACCLLIGEVCQAAPDADRVHTLPGFGPPPTPHYSGYLDSGDQCDTNLAEVVGNSNDEEIINKKKNCQLHYWLATASMDGVKDDKNYKDNDKDWSWTEQPLVLWLNGGPGSSSVEGMLQENGPLLLNATGNGLMENPYAWNRHANFLILESPVGVGFSYCAAQKRNSAGLCHSTDTSTATTALAALLDLYDRFPELQSNPLYITGESYAGVYIPTLAAAIVKHNFAVAAQQQQRYHHIKHTSSQRRRRRDTVRNNYTTATTTSTMLPLRGLAVGNPCTDNVAQRQSMNVLWYAHKNGLVDEAVYAELTSERCRAGVTAVLVEEALSFSKFDGMGRSTTSTTTTTRRAYTTWMDDNLNSNSDDTNCILAVRKFMLSTSNRMSQVWKDLFVSDFSLFAPVSDTENQAMVEYMNRPDVQDALHVTDSPLRRWPTPDAGFSYQKEFNACNRFSEPEALSMIDVYQFVLPHLDRVWIYNGDTDPCVSYEGTRTAVTRMGESELDGGGYRPWFYNHTATSTKVIQEKALLFGPDLLLEGTGIQLGGHVVNFENGLSFLTVHGSGHMVPQFRPQAASHMFQRFLKGDHNNYLTPLFASNATLVTLSDDEFLDEMDAWTEKAMSASFVRE